MPCASIVQVCKHDVCMWLACEHGCLMWPNSSGVTTHLSISIIHKTRGLWTIYSSCFEFSWTFGVQCRLSYHNQRGSKNTTINDHFERVSPSNRASFAGVDNSSHDPCITVTFTICRTFGGSFNQTLLGVPWKKGWNLMRCRYVCWRYTWVIKKQWEAGV